MTNEELIKIVREIRAHGVQWKNSAANFPHLAEQSIVKGTAEGLFMAANLLDSHIPPEAYDPQGISIQVGKWYRLYNSRRVRCTGTSLCNRFIVDKEVVVYNFHVDDKGSLYAQLDDRGRDCQGNQIIIGEVEV